MVVKEDDLGDLEGVAPFERCRRRRVRSRRHSAAVGIDTPRGSPLRSRVLDEVVASVRAELSAAEQPDARPVAASGRCLTPVGPLRPMASSSSTSRRAGRHMTWWPRCDRLAGTRKVGHAGTLDPMATGVLICGVGRATRLLGYLSGNDKSYTATVRLGQSTVTDDAEGDVTGGASASQVTERSGSRDSCAFRWADLAGSVVGECGQSGWPALVCTGAGRRGRPSRAALGHDRRAVGGGVCSGRSLTCSMSTSS